MYINKSFIVILLALLLVGCSSLGRIDELMVSSGEVGVIKQNVATVKVSVIGGDRRFVSSELFKTALEDNLEKLQLFTLVKDGDAHYKLDVIILRAEFSGMGAGYQLSSQWILMHNGEEVWSENVTGMGSSSALGGHARIRAASERANKENIRNGINMLGELSL